MIVVLRVILKVKILLSEKDKMKLCILFLYYSESGSSDDDNNNIQNLGGGEHMGLNRQISYLRTISWKPRNKKILSDVFYCNCSCGMSEKIY